MLGGWPRGVMGMGSRKAPDPRPEWEQEDEIAEPEFRLRERDRRLIRAGGRAATLSGGLAGVVMGPLPTAVAILVRAAMGGGWSVAHWEHNLFIYSILAVGIGFPMGWLRRRSCLGHRFRMVPMAGVRAGADTWLGLVVIDTMLIIFVMEDALGVLLLFTVWGLVWIGLLYALVWAAVQGMLLTRFWPTMAAPAPVVRG